MSVLLGGGLDETKLRDVVGQPLQQPEPQLRPGLLATPEHDGDLHFVPRVEESHNVALLRLVIVGVDLGAELLFFDNRHLLVAAGLTGLLRSLVFELAEVHELADWWAGLCSNLDQVKVRFLS